MFQSTTTSFTASSFALAILTFGFGARALAAQELDVQVARDPAASTATYTIDLDGPPRGTGVLFVAPSLLPLPLPLPGIGALHLNPLMTLSLGSIPLDSKGRGQMKFTIPLRFVDNSNFYFQGLMNDRGILRTTRNWCSSHLYAAPVDDSLIVGLAHNSKTQTYKGEFRGRAGATVEIVHYRGSQLDIWQAKIPANGILPVKFCYRNKLKHGDAIEIRYNGKQFKTWRR